MVELKCSLLVLTMSNGQEAWKGHPLDIQLTRRRSPKRNIIPHLYLRPFGGQDRSFRPFRKPRPLRKGTPDICISLAARLLGLTGLVTRDRPECQRVWVLLLGVFGSWGLLWEVGTSLGAGDFMFCCGGERPLRSAAQVILLGLKGSTSQEGHGFALVCSGGAAKRLLRNALTPKAFKL